MKQKKKNTFFTFICSFLPGAAEMYMGFMKNGLSLMIIFFLSFTPVLFMDLLEGLLSLSAVIWFFGFFHARNYANMDDKEFEEMEDKYFWEELGDFKSIKFSGKSTRLWLAVILIFLGVAQLWEYFSNMLYRMIPDYYWDDYYPLVRNIPQILLSVLFIIIGVRLIAGKKKELDSSSIEVKQIPDFSQNQENSQEKKEA